MHAFLRCVLSGAVAVLSTVAAAETPTEWPAPNRPVVIVTPTPGGAADAIARIVSAEMSKTLGAGFAVVARTGAGGNIASESVARAAPDGHTLLLALGSMLTINPALYEKLSFDPIKDFQPVALLATAPYVLAVNSQVTASTVAEFVDTARARPKGVFFSSPGNGTPNHLLGVLFNQAAGVSMEHVPYRSTTAAITDLLGNQVQATFGSLPSVMPMAKSGQLKVLGVTSEQRSQLAPGVPTIAETLPGYGFQSWYALLAPAKTPPAVVAKLSAAATAALSSKQVIEQLTVLGAEAAPGSPQQLAALIRSDLARWTPIVKSSGASAN